MTSQQDAMMACYYLSNTEFTEVYDVNETQSVRSNSNDSNVTITEVS